jgi:hypothetical protein
MANEYDHPERRIKNLDGREYEHIGGEELRKEIFSSQGIDVDENAVRYAIRRQENGSWRNNFN